jgi:uncharacterized membrane protein
METKALQLKRRIMRRVYVAFAVRIAQHPITLQVGLFAVSLLLFAKLVHVQRILESLLSSSLQNLPQYLFNNIAGAFQRGEVLTLLTLGVMLFVALSVPMQVWRLRLPKWKKHAVV